MSPKEVLYIPNMLCSIESHSKDRHLIDSDKKNSKLYNESLTITSYIVKKRLGMEQKYSKIGEKAYELCDSMIYKHEPFFKNLPNRIGLTRDTIRSTTKSILNEVLGDSINFGRIVSILATSLTFCEHFYNTKDMSDCIDCIVETTAEVIYENRQWFESNGGWDGFMDQFSSTNAGTSLWKGFFITTVGLGAMAGLLYSKS